MAFDMKARGREVSDLWKRIRAIAGEDDEAVVDTVDGEGDAIQALRRTVRMALEAEANASACKDLSASYRERQKALEGRAIRYREAAASFLQEVGEKTLRLPEATITWRDAGPQIVGDIPSPSDLPDDCVTMQRVRHEPSIKKALGDGRRIGDLYLSNGGVALTMRKV